MSAMFSQTIWTFVLILYGSRFTTSLGLFPKMESLADYAPINSSSTCGTPSIQVCRSSSQISSLDVCTEDTCRFGCCPTCSKDKPSPSDLGNHEFTRKVGIVPGESRPGSSDTSFSFESSSNSHMDPLNIPGVNYKTKGFSLSAWVKQKPKNKGTLFSKGMQSSSYKVIFQLEIKNYKIWFHYQYNGSGNTSVVELNPLQSQSQHLNENEWHFITVTVINTSISYFIDGQFIKAALLKGSISDHGGHIRIGQIYGGGSQYEGLMQDIFMYGISLTNREVVESYSGKLPKAYVASECRCPPAYPKIMESSRARCTKNGEFSSLGQSALRLASAHPIELASDGDTTTYWQSELTNDAVISLDLKYGEMLISYIILEFYGPQPGAIIIERSRDGYAFQPWQYFAENCVKSFNMPNNGPLAQPDSVNCIQYELPLKSSLASISFKTEQPPASGSPVPKRPFGSPCTNLYCSKKLLQFLKASHVKFSFYNHTLVKNEKHRYFALRRIIVAGRCECFGHAREATYNATHKTCVCQCVPSTFTEGEKCDRCQQLYNNKAFRRGSNTDSFPCIKCQCNEHASRCYYNESLDPNPNSRTDGGGGVCIDCQHNTTGRYCHICKENFYKESSKSLSARDVCTSCGCTGPGVLPNRLDCVKNGSIVGVKEGQCECKNYTQGRQCDECKPGYFDLKSGHVTGCVPCQCNTTGTVSGNTTCQGQCDCKSNVTGVKCDTCRSGFYGLSSLEPTGCKACGCNPFGSLDTLCDKATGQCFCKVGPTGRRCDRCADGYHSLGRDGCKSCNCSSAGSQPNLLSNCQKNNGQCYCKTNAEGKKCDRCRVGYFNLSSANPNGCTPCTCDPKGTVGMSSQCESMSGNCTCKRYVIGNNCNQCQPGYFNISLSNPVGCQPFNRFPNGTKDPKNNTVVVNQQTATNVTVNEGEDIMINCSNSAQGEGQWKNEDGTDINLSSRIKIEDNNVLVFRNSSKDDAGVYKCLRGKSVHLVNLRVKVTVKVKISLRILNWNFTNEIQDKSSGDYRRFEENFKKQMDIVYQNIKGYQGVEILELRNGSIRVVFRVIVVQVINNKGERTTFRRVVVAQKIVDEAKTGWINKNLQVDTSPDAFETDAPPPQPENVTLVEATDDGAEISWDKPINHEYYGIKGYFIEYWVFGTSNIENTGVFKGQRTKITGLKDDTSYTARVVGKNQERGQESDNIDIKTKKAVLAGWIIALIVIFCILFLVLIIALIIFLCRRRKMQNERERQEVFAMSKIKQEKVEELERGQPQLKSYTNKTYMTDGHWTEFPRETLVLQDELGSGEFGVVHRGQLLQDGYTTECAVKTLKAAAGPEEHRALYEELEIMANVGNHPNLVNLIGATAEEDKLFVIVEFARHGSLIEYLRSQRLKPEEEYEFDLKYVNRLRIALDVAKGMAFLQRKRCVHRDLAARNVLLADDFVAKVADFGLSRDIYETGEYEKTTTGKMPTRWMAIESLELRRFTLKSDVWSFGVLLWEIETKGLMPHGAVSYIELLDQLKRGYRLEQPKGTPDELYELMQNCWEANPINRPDFPDVRDTLETLLSGAPEYLEENPYRA